jgi:hypothetical protein
MYPHVDNSCRRIREDPAGKTPFPVGIYKKDTISSRKSTKNGSRNPLNGSGLYFSTWVNTRISTFGMEFFEKYF